MPQRPPGPSERHSGSRLRRFVVSDRSMEPAFHDGDGIIALRTSTAKVGQIRCVEHPDRPNFWLVKRVESIHSDGTIDVASDNRSLATVDSRQFGPVPVAGTYRVLARIPARWM